MCVFFVGHVWVGVDTITMGQSSFGTFLKGKNNNTTTSEDEKDADDNNDDDDDDIRCGLMRLMMKSA